MTTTRIWGPTQALNPSASDNSSKKPAGGHPLPVGATNGVKERKTKMKKLAMCATAAMSVWLAGCGGALGTTRPADNAPGR